MSSFRVRVRVAAWLGLAVAGLGPTGALAQERVRVVEAVAEGTGDRQRYVVRDLDEDEIRSVQRALREAGHVGIGWTGRLDDGTRNGLRRFQAARGLVECGCVSYETVVALGLRPEIVATIPAPAGSTGRDPAGLYADWDWVYPIAIPVPILPPCDGKECDGGGDVPVVPGGGLPATPPGTATPPGFRPPPPTEPRPLPPSSRQQD